MTAYLLTDHLVNFIAPAAFVALVLVLLARLFSRFSKHKRPVTRGLLAQVAIIFIADLVVMAAGLVLFGNDGKMATYAAMVVAAGACQWLLGRGWRG